MCNIMENLKTTLTCKWELNGSQSHFMVENFRIDNDQGVAAYGLDQCGSYSYLGKAEPDGRLTLTRTYTNLQGVMPLAFQGQINKDSTITGEVINQGALAGNFTFKPMLKAWEGYFEDSNKKVSPVKYYFAFNQASLYGYGVDDNGLYILRGAYEHSASKIILSEFRIGQHGKVFDGVYRLDGGQGSITGNYTLVGEGSGTFSLKEVNETMGNAPPMDFIKSEQTDPKPSSGLKDLTSGGKKELAKPGLTIEGQQSQPVQSPAPAPQPTQMPPQAQNPGQFQMPMQAPMQYAYQQPGFQGYAQGYPPMYPGTNYVYQAPAPDLTKYITFTLMSSMPEGYLIPTITYQLQLGKRIMADDFASIMKIQTNDRIRRDLCHVTCHAVDGMHPALFISIIKSQADANVQLTFAQTFGHLVRGMLTPQAKMEAINAVVFNREQEGMRSIMSQL